MKKLIIFICIIALFCIIFGGFKVVQYRQEVIELNSKNNSLISGNELLLKKLIETECDLEGKSDFEKLNILRNWVYLNVNWSEQPCEKPFFGLTAGELFTNFYTNKITVMCGGTAYALESVYKLFGYEACTMDSGIVGVMTHVITLVKINYNSKEIYNVQDATFNTTYTVNDEPIDYFAMLKKLKELSYTDITINPITTAINKNIRTYKQFIEKFSDGLYRSFKSDGFPSHLFYIYMYPLSSDNIDNYEKAKNITSKQ